MVGRNAEAGGIAKDGAKMVMAVANAEVGFGGPQLLVCADEAVLGPQPEGWAGFLVAFEQRLAP